MIGGGRLGVSAVFHVTSRETLLWGVKGRASVPGYPLHQHFQGPASIGPRWGEVWVKHAAWRTPVIVTWPVWIWGRSAHAV